MKLHHIIEAQQFDVPMLLRLLDIAEEMEKLVQQGGTTDYHNRIMATLFYEPSTRTRFSLRRRCTGWADG
jgi:aspartate carbamoyltransferase catalytic subunit